MNTFRKYAAAITLAGATGAMVTVPASAHHSFAMFDQTKVTEKTSATVTEFRYTNPHSFVVVNVKEGGKVARYLFECSSVSEMSRVGWKHNTIKAGDKVDVAFYPLRNGRPGGMLKTITLADGRTLNAW